MPDRGPSETELALNAETRDLLALYAHEEKTKHLFDNLVKSQAKVTACGEQPRRPNLDILRASWQVHRGDAFWERTPAEPTPIRQAK